jgi:hypothetical protein
VRVVLDRELDALGFLVAAASSAVKRSNSAMTICMVLLNDGTGDGTRRG